MSKITLPETPLITRAALLLAFTIVLQSFRLPPVVTGPLINFMLILATIIVGTAAGVFIGLLTPLIALLAGILPAPLAPAIPFIMGGNALYCWIFGTLGEKGGRRWPALGVASLAKFVVIAGAASLLLALPSPVVEMLFFPQLIHAFFGGAVAIGAGHYLQQVIYKSSPMRSAGK